MKKRNLEQKNKPTREHTEALRKLRSSFDKQRAPGAETSEQVAAVLEMLRMDRENLQQQNEKIAASLQAIKAECQGYKALFDLAPGAYLVTDTKGVILKANRAAAALLNIRQDSLEGKLLTNFVDEAQLKSFGLELSRLSGLEQSKNLETEPKPQGSGSFPAAINVTVVQDPQKGSTSLLWMFRDISEHKRTEESLRRSEERFRTILENIQDGYFEVDLAGNFTFVNDSLCRMHGKPKSEMVGLNDRDYTDQGGAKKLYQAFNALYRTGEPIEILDFEVIRKDGTRAFNEISASLIKNAEGKSIGFRGITRDVTERKLAEARVLKQTILLYAINTVLREALTCETEQEVARTCLGVVEDLTASRFGFIGEVNSGGRFDTIALSDPGWQACKMQIGEAAKVIADMEIRGIWGKVIKEGRSLIVNDPASHPDRVGLPDGHVALTAFLGVPLRSAGRTAGMIALANKESGYTEQDLETVEILSAVFAEVLHRKRAEQAVKRYGDSLEDMVKDRTKELTMASDLLRRSEERYRSLATATAQIIWTTNAIGEVVDDSPTWRAFTGQSEQEYLGLGWSDTLHPDDLEQAVRLWLHSVQTASVYETEYRIRRRDGEYRYCIARAVPVLEKDRSIREWVGICTDITERKQAEEKITNINVELEQRVRERTKELEKAYEDLKALDKAKDTFLSSVSHELRTPLTSIRSFSEILLNYDGMDVETQKEFLEIINRESERLTRLINDVLDLSKIEAGMGIWNDELLSLEETIRIAASVQRPFFEEKGLTLRVEIPPDFPQVFADRDRIQQVITNLLSNATKFSFRASEIHIKAEIFEGKRAGERLEWVKVSISDQGIGIEEKDFKTIFEKFQQISTDTLLDKPKGTGLGLPICKEIISHYGGNIWVESKKGEGSTFFFTIPGASSAATSTTTHLQAREDALGSKRNTILVVDDEAPIRDLLRVGLEDMGYQVYTAGDGEQAVDLLKSRVPGLVLVILDMVLPKKNGDDLVRWIRKEPHICHVPVMIFSGYPLPSEQEDLLSLREVHYAKKSQGMSSLFESIPLIIRKAGSQSGDYVNPQMHSSSLN